MKKFWALMVIAVVFAAGNLSVSSSAYACGGGDKGHAEGGSEPSGQE